jgi:3-oxoacyl-[acyl-carrier-protein] synthase-3
MTMHARITGTGSYLPDRVLTNKQLEAMVDTTDQWIRERTGIRTRHIAAEGETTCDLAEQAARRALESAGRVPGDVDLIVLATTTPDKIFPSTACLLQQRLDIHGCPAFDVQAVCTGLSTRSGSPRSSSRRDRHAAPWCSVRRPFPASSTGRIARPACCSVMAQARSSSSAQMSREFCRRICMPTGPTRSFAHARRRVPRIRSAGRWGDPHFTQMKGNEVFKMAVNTLGRIVDETLHANGLKKTDIDWLVPHQANIRIINATARKLNMNMDHVVVTVEHHGNTSAASVPLALDVAVRDGRIQRGETVLLEAFGGGFTWGAVLLKF